MIHYYKFSNSFLLTIMLLTLLTFNNLYASSQKGLSYDEILKLVTVSNILHRNVASFVERVKISLNKKSDNSILYKLILEGNDLLLETKKLLSTISKNKIFEISKSQSQYDYIVDTYNYYTYTKKDYAAALEIMPALAELVYSLNSALSSKIESVEAKNYSYSSSNLKGLSYGESLKLAAATKVIYKKAKTLSEKASSAIRAKKDNDSLNSLVQEASRLFQDARKLVAVYSKIKYKDLHLENKLRHFELLEDSYYYYINTEKNFVAALELMPAFVDVLEGLHFIISSTVDVMRPGENIKLK